MAEGLAVLPSLEELHVTLHRWSKTCAFPFDKFGHLSVLRVTGAEADHSIPNIRKLIQASPQLRDLYIGVPADSETFRSAFSDIIPPSLRHLGILDQYAGTLNNAPLSLLTSLEVPNNFEVYTSPLWGMLASCHVQLHNISVELVNASLLSYLVSYQSGLRSMRVRLGMCTSPQAREMLSRLLSEGIRGHRATLETLEIDTDRRRDCTSSVARHPYALGREQLGDILGCAVLTSLSVVVHQPSGGQEAEVGFENGRGLVTVVSIAFASFSSTLTFPRQTELLSVCAASQTRLRRLTIVPAWSYDSSRRSEVTVQRREAKEAMLNEIQSLEVAALDTFKFSVRVLDTPLVVTRKDDIAGQRRYMFTTLPLSSASSIRTRNSDASIRAS